MFIVRAEARSPSDRRAMFIVPSRGTFALRQEGNVYSSSRGTFALRQEGHVLLFSRVAQFDIALLTEGASKYTPVFISPPISIHIALLTEGALKYRPVSIAPLT